MAETEIMLRSEHKRILSAAQGRYDVEIKSRKSGVFLYGVVTGLAMGFVIGMLSTGAAIYAVFAA